MTECLETKKSNCKNCYKCIRHCPVKSIKFYDGQAHIIRDECVLCGECYVVCPQNAKQIRSDVGQVREMISAGREVYVSLAPAFAARYPKSDTKEMEAALQKLGVKGASETAIGAEIVKKQYERLLRENRLPVLISSCCHTVNTLIEKHYKNAVPYLADVVSPMLAHGIALKKEHPGCKVVFIGPCISKKAEAEKYGGIIDAVLTFDELDGWLEEAGVQIQACPGARERHRANSFPTSGGILRSMDMDPGINYLVVDGMEQCMQALEDIDNQKLSNCFIEMSACSGSCLSGPVMKRSARNPIMDLVSVNGVTGQDEYGVEIPPQPELVKKFRFEGTMKTMPGSAAIEEILHKMGKNSKEQELNCGSCGYNTCREKAVAVFMGKAELSMCMPYLMARAESFSDTIINNTPNGIIVLDEELNVQQMNSAARKLLNLPSATDVLGSPVVRILDPVDYVIALDEGKNVYDRRKYLAEYRKYVEETIIYDREYHILMILMKDVSEEEHARSTREAQSKAAIEITDKVVEKQMRIVQEIASLLGETTAETKIALTKLKETLRDE